MSAELVFNCLQCDIFRNHQVQPVSVRKQGRPLWRSYKDHKLSWEHILTGFWLSNPYIPYIPYERVEQRKLHTVWFVVHHKPWRQHSRLGLDNHPVSRYCNIILFNHGHMAFRMFQFTWKSMITAFITNWNSGFYGVFFIQTIVP